MRQPDELLAAAFHESGHAVAYVTAVRTAPWLPFPRPQPHFVYIAKTVAGWCGKFSGPSIYSPRWPIDCVTPRFKPLMEAQVMIELVGAVCEALHRGEEVSVVRCGCDGDLGRAFDLLDGDLFRLTGCRPLLPHIERTRALLLAHWPAVERLSRNLIELGHIEGGRVQQIIAASCPDE